VAATIQVILRWGSHLGFGFGRCDGAIGVVAIIIAGVLANVAAMVATVATVAPTSAYATELPPAPEWQYSVLESPHFELVYRLEQRALAEHYLQAAERAHDILSGVFSEMPASRTLIVLRDNTDFANGLADFLPYPRIVIYPVLPSSGDTIDEYGDWALEMMLHEYTHILNMYPSHGVYTPLRWIFGGMVRPNAVLPKWYLEGLAVYMESAKSTHGRLRSTQTRAAARALSLDLAWARESLPSINEVGLPSWPGRARPYLFGGWWWQDTLGSGSEGWADKWNQDFSRRAPFLLNAPIRHLAGHSPSELLSTSQDRRHYQARAELEALAPFHSALTVETRAHASRDAEIVTFDLNASRQLVMATTHPKGGQVISIHELGAPGAPMRKLFTAAGVSQVAWLSADELVYDAADGLHPHTQFRDLYSYNVRTGKAKRLTNGARAQFPSPYGGNQVVFIENDAGRNHVGILDLESHTWQRVIEGDFGHRFSSPIFLDSETLAVVERNAFGEDRVHKYSRDGQDEIMLEKIGPIARLRLDSSASLSSASPKSDKPELWLTSAKSGVRNVYQMNEAHALTAFTNTPTDIQDFVLDRARGEMLISELTSKGYRLRAVKPESYQPKELPKSDFAPPPLGASTAPPTTPFRERSYRPLRYLYPRYWIPFVYQADGGFVLEGLTSNYDPVERHLYDAQVSYDSISRRGSYGVGYTNRVLPWEVSANYSHFQSYLGASDLSVDTQRAEVSGAPWISRLTDLRLGGTWSEAHLGSQTYRRLGPRAQWSYSNLSNPSAGAWRGSIQLDHREYLRQDGYLSYGQSGFAVSGVGLVGEHKFVANGRGSFAPNLRSGALLVMGERSVGGNYSANLLNSDNLLRGYPSGTFIGRKILNGNLEWSHPLTRVDWGYGTLPVFLGALDVALLADALAVDGAGFDWDLDSHVRSSLGEWYTGGGSEFRLHTTLGYHMPVSVTLGLYYGLTERFGGGFSTFLALGIGDFGPLGNKTP